jgi:2,4-dienoyl-CoA reductase (NADPH2)
LSGIDHPMVLSYLDVLKDHKEVGKKVAIIGAGGIGFDVAEYLVHSKVGDLQIADFARDWGIDLKNEARGGLIPSGPEAFQASRQITMLQRSEGKLGRKLGKTTGWIHRTTLRKAGVKMLDGVSYIQIDDRGLHIEKSGKPMVLEVDNIIVCAGQLSNRSLYEEFKQVGVTTHLIGGAKESRELDAKFAIETGYKLALNI